jgi:hypothetical protein
MLFQYVAVKILHLPDAVAVAHGGECEPPCRKADSPQSSGETISALCKILARTHQKFLSAALWSGQQLQAGRLMANHPVYGDHQDVLFAARIERVLAERLFIFIERGANAAPETQSETRQQTCHRRGGLSRPVAH